MGTAGEPLVSVIVATWNGSELIGACLDSVLASRHRQLEVVVVDNASTDATAEVVATRFPSARLLRSDRNLGFAGACNRGLEMAQGAILALLNQDTVVDPTWIPELIAALRRPGVDIVGSRCVFPDGRIQSAGGRVEWPLGIARARGGAPESFEWDHSCEVDYVSGCGMAFSRRVVDRIAGFDEAFWPGYYEDVDFCLRGRARGFRSWYAPKARLIHLEGSSFSRWPSRWRFHHRGRIHLVLNHAAERFVGEFLPAERLYLPAISATAGARLLARAYREAIVRSVAPARQRGRLEAAQARRIERGLLDLAELALSQSGAGASPWDPSGRSPAPRLAALRVALRQSQRHLVEAWQFERRQRGVCESALEATLATREAELGSLKARLADLEQQLRSERRVREARDREIESLTHVRAELERELASEKNVRLARDEELASEKSVRLARDEELASERSVRLARDEELASEKSVRLARDEELASLTAVLDAREQERASEKRVRLARDEELAATRSLLEARARELESCLDLQGQREMELARLEAELAEIRATLPGRLGERWSRRGRA